MSAGLPVPPGCPIQAEELAELPSRAVDAVVIAGVMWKVKVAERKVEERKVGRKKVEVKWAVDFLVFSTELIVIVAPVVDLVAVDVVAVAA